MDALKTLNKLRPKKVPDPPKQPKRLSKGKTTTLGICQFWVTVFTANEGCPKHRRLNDESIKQLVIREYPGQPAAIDLQEGRKSVNFYRILYNCGRFTQGVRPKVQSNRYDDKGEIIPNRKYKKEKKKTESS